MFRREDDKLTNTTIWQDVDFKKVKQRLNRITNQVEGVLAKSYKIQAVDLIDAEDYAKLREFMEVNELTESQAIATIVHAFFSHRS
jgi:L-arabinose isomerase